ncbi:MAG: hypothetical protein OXE50_05795 [Chloroflexi bacterium]|nr:hypothetical protein [Chloroflexota bacterium]
MVVVVLGLAMLAGCGSDDPAPTPTTTTPSGSMAEPTPTAASTTPSESMAGPTPTAASTTPSESMAAPTPTPVTSSGGGAAPTPTAAPAATDTDLSGVWDGKTISIAVGYSPGGGADAQARLLAIHLPRFLPGDPRVIVTNKPGGGTALNARDMLRRPTDGTYIAQFAQGLMVAGAMGQAEDWFVWDAYTYLGMVDGAQEENLSLMCGRTDKMQNLDDFLNGGPWRLGDISPDTTGGKQLKWFELTDVPLDIFFGYGGSAETAAAFDRGEMDVTTRCNATYAKQYSDWFTQELAIPLFGWGNFDPDIQVPNDQPLADGMRSGRWPWFGDMHETLSNYITEQQFAAFDAFTALGGTHVWAIPPDVPEEIASTLQRAFLETVNSQGFIDDMTRRERVVAPLSGLATQERIQTLQDLPPDAKAILEQML